MSPHISIKAEKVFEILGFPITNSLLVTTLVIVVFSFIARYYYQELQKEDRSLVFYGLHAMFVGLYGMFESVLRKNVNVFYGLLGSFFFFILLSNWSGLVPGVGSILIEPQIHLEEIAESKEIHGSGKIPLLRGGTADLNTTVALALLSVILTQIFGFKYLGAKAHLKKYFNFKDPIMIMLGPLEIIQELAR
ncbi:hypothetical protein COU87_01190, partial [Candidatus Roizmanbacteria bacterium CG10_big_fil_rev_8_21_14_0_10_39_12]